MNAHVFGALLGLLATVSVSAAQDPSKKAAPPDIAEVRMEDGSIIRVTLPQSSVEVETKYGKLIVPLRDVRRIDFGLRVPPDVAKNIEGAIRNLGSDVHKEREAAERVLLKAGYRAYQPLKELLKKAPPHLEVERRAEAVLKKIEGKVPPELRELKAHDVVHAASFPIVGRVIGKNMEVHSTHLGKIVLEFSDVRRLDVRTADSEREFTIDAAKHGSAPDQWLDSGITVDPSVRVVIRSEGQVDLWPQGPGQYLASPKGYTTAGRGGQFQAGALIARIGESGKAFHVGERFEGTPTEEGRLYFHIVPSPWNNASTGGFTVHIRTHHVLLAR